MSRFLFSTAEPHPTFRPDVQVLFGKYLAQLGVATDLVTTIDPSVPAQDWPAGRLIARKARGGLVRMLWIVWLDLTLAWRARRGYDGIIFRDKPILAIVGLIAARLWRLPFMYWMSFPMPEYWLQAGRATPPGGSRIRSIYATLRGQLGWLLLYGFVLRRADHVFVQSDAMKDDLVRRGFDPQRMTAVPMGVDFDLVDRTPAEAVPGTEGRPLAVYLGTLDRARRTDLLVDAAAKVRQQIPDFVLAFIGETDEKSERGWLQDYARSTGAGDAVVFTGRVPYARGIAMAKSARVGLSPVPRSPLFDVGTPTKVVEYLGMGLPVVCNDQPDQRELIEGSGGGLCVALESDAIAAAIVELLGDRDRATAMARQGREFVVARRSYAALARSVAKVLSAKDLGSSPRARLVSRAR